MANLHGTMSEDTFYAIAPIWAKKWTAESAELADIEREIRRLLERDVTVQCPGDLLLYLMSVPRDLVFDERAPKPDAGKFTWRNVARGSMWILLIVPRVVLEMWR